MEGSACVKPFLKGNILLFTVQNAGTANNTDQGRSPESCPPPGPDLRLPLRSSNNGVGGATDCHRESVWT